MNTFAKNMKSSPVKNILQIKGANYSSYPGTLQIHYFDKSCQIFVIKQYKIAVFGDLTRRF